MKKKVTFSKKRINGSAARLTIVFSAAVAFFFAGGGLLSAEPPKSPFGADAVPDIYAPSLAGPGGFTTTTGGAPASALNPAQGGDARRMIFDAGYLAIPCFGNEEGYMNSIEGGMLFPTRYGVFGTSLRYIGHPLFKPGIVFQSFPIERTFGGNIFAAKEIYPGMSVGAGLNFGFGSDWTLSADLGFRYNLGNLGPFQNFTWAAVLRGLGKSYFPTWLAPAGGVSFDLIRIEGEEGRKTPFVLNVSGDLEFPSLFYPPYANMIFKAGLKMDIAETLCVSFSWPGGSGLNMRELDAGYSLPVTPSVGISVNIVLPSGGERIAGGRLPSDGDLTVSGAYKPLYEGVTAIGGGLTWYVGMADKKPPVIKVDYPETAYFSPNHDGKADYLEFPVSITDDNYVVSWEMEIKDEEGNAVRTIQNKETRPESFTLKGIFSRITAVKKHIDVPPVLVWDGVRETGDISEDGKYFFTVTASDDSGNIGISPVYETVLKNTPPEISIDALDDVQKIFNPKGGGGDKDTITFTPHGSEEDAWEGGIYNAAGVKIRAFEIQKGHPHQQVWDGKDDSGGIAPDGVYSYRISATDRAKNTASAAINNIILDARETGIFLTSSVSHIAPQPNQGTNLVDFSIILSLQEGVAGWQLSIKDRDGAAIRTFSGVDRVPFVQGWNGLDERGAISEGVYTPELTVNYIKGDVVKTQATTVTVDISGPLLSFVSEPEYFSPDNDGVDDELFIYLSAQDVSPIADWSLEIRVPESGSLFYRIEGRGAPSERIAWNGRSNTGELVQSATDYPYVFTAKDILGNSSAIEGKIGVDVLVVRDGDLLRILIPSIVFRPNYADFVGLSKETVDNNNRIIRRIAQILNKFREYKVKVEGHANPTQPVGAARNREEPELKRISEARAKAIVDLLVSNGVARNRLSYIGVGGSRTVVPPEDRFNAWKNRRVEFILEK
ncbi:MAG: OmpA family protein [Treponema sp.]|jgi:flagellar motor protein MotB|nr:OmpA family protein [Treponema sp.]